jgi:hypothetical protein
MTWKLFIDDERWPKEGTGPWTICRCSYDAIEMIKELGMPEEIAFDHDLGLAVDENDNEYFDTTMKLIHWIIDEHYDNGLVIPSNFTFTVHSANPIGAQNIKELMNGFLNDIHKI